jgi:hypothetical protein
MDPIFMASQGELDSLTEYGEPLIASKWYFWDETWVDAIGPYDSEEQARTALKEYCAQL